MAEKYYTVKEAAEDYFQGKVSAREVYGLFTRGELLGFRVGNKILIYLTSLDAYQLAHKNGAPPAAKAPPGTPQPARVREAPLVRLNRLPE